MFTKFFQIIGGPGGFKPSDPNSIFNQFFQNFGGGGGGLDDDFIFSGLGGSRPGDKRRSTDMNDFFGKGTISLTLEEIYKGTTKKQSYLKDNQWSNWKASTDRQNSEMILLYFFFRDIY